MGRSPTPPHSLARCEPPAPQEPPDIPRQHPGRHASEPPHEIKTEVPSPTPSTAITTAAATRPGMARTADLVLRNGRISTGDPARAEAAALAVSAGRITRPVR